MQKVVKRLFHDLNGQVPSHIFEYLNYLSEKGQKSLINLAYSHANWNQSLSLEKEYALKNL